MKQGICLIDAQNIFYTPRKKYKTRVDFLKLKNLIAAGREMRFIIYVVADAVVDQEGFLQMLMRHGYEPRVKVMYWIDGAPKNTNWDDDIIRDAEKLIDSVDVLSIVSGDHCFGDVMAKYRKEGKRVELYCFKREMSLDLIAKTDLIHFLGPHIFC